jgi:hypothetical protein
MCTRKCDCNNCMKTKTCVDCEYQNEAVNPGTNCYTDGVQGCNHRIPTRAELVKEGEK